MARSLLEIVDPADNYDLITLDEVKSQLNITNDTQDEDLKRKIHEASEEINKYCNRIFISEVVKETWRGSNQPKKLFLRRTPVMEIASITSGGEEVDSDLYEFDPLDGIGGFIYPLDVNGLRECYPFSWNSWGWFYNQVLIVNYTGGYEIESVPYNVKKACVELIKASRLVGGGSPGSNVQRVEIPGVWTKWFDTASADSNDLFSQTIKDLLNPFKKTSFPS